MCIHTTPLSEWVGQLPCSSTYLTQTLSIYTVCNSPLYSRHFRLDSNLVSRPAEGKFQFQLLHDSFLMEDLCIKAHCYASTHSFGSCSLTMTLSVLLYVKECVVSIPQISLLLIHLSKKHGGISQPRQNFPKTYRNCSFCVCL